MSKSQDHPPLLQPFIFHGVVVEKKGSGQPHGECLFCGKMKFYVKPETGEWDCKACMKRGNLTTFMRELHAESVTRTTDESLDKFASERGYLSSHSLKQWGVCMSALTRDWVTPTYTVNGEVWSLYRYMQLPGTMKKVLVAVPGADSGVYGTGHRMYGTGLTYNPKAKHWYICEGPWDAIALWEMLGRVKEDGKGGYALTSSVKNSLRKSACVLAVPSATTFSEEWAIVFDEAPDEMTLTFCYDNDHPKKHPQTGVVVEPVGYAGMRRAALLCAAKLAHKEPVIKYLGWGHGNKDNRYDPDLPSGHDVRDLLSGDTAGDRVKGFTSLMNRIHPIPKEWFAGTVITKSGSVELEPLHCDSWKKLQNSWRKAMKWTDGLDRALSFMLSIVASTEIPGDQIWGKVVGPPSCGKSTLCEAVTVAKKYVTAKSTIRGFHSGYQVDKEGSEDCSLIQKLKNKTLITKDGDTLLTSPNLTQILSEARDIYDRVSRTDYRNKMSRDYEGINLTWLLCGTSSLRSLDDSELGQRFLDCVIMDEISEELEDDINMRKINQFRTMIESAGAGTGRDGESAEMVEAKRLTGGYVIHMRRDWRTLASSIRMSDDRMKGIISVGTFVAFMRARPSKKQDEEVSRELSTRLVSQFTKLAYCLAIVLNKESIDDDVMQRLTHVARDTSRGVTVDLLRHLRKAGDKGHPMSSLVVMMPLIEEKRVRTLIQFLCRIKALESFTGGPSQFIKGTLRYKLTARMRGLWDAVMGAPAIEHTDEEDSD